MLLDIMELIQHLGVESLLLCCELGSRSDGDRLLSVVLRPGHQITTTKRPKMSAMVNTVQPISLQHQHYV